MAVPSVTEAVATIASATAVLEIAQWYSTIVVENGTNEDIFVRTDGTAASITAAGNEQIPPGATLAFPNQQPQPNANGNGGVPLKFGWTTQNNNMVYASGFPTYVSAVAGAATPSPAGSVTFSAQ